MSRDRARTQSLRRARERLVAICVVAVLVVGVGVGVVVDDDLRIANTEHSVPVLFITQTDVTAIQTETKFQLELQCSTEDCTHAVLGVDLRHALLRDEIERHGNVHALCPSRLSPGSGRLRRRIGGDPHLSVAVDVGLFSPPCTLLPTLCPDRPNPVSSLSFSSYRPTHRRKRYFKDKHIRVLFSRPRRYVPRTEVGAASNTKLILAIGSRYMLSSYN